MSTRCIAGESSAPYPTPKAAEKTVEVKVDSHGGRSQETNNALENFAMDSEGPNTAFFRGQDDERVALKDVERIQFYDNVVIIRLRDGTGRIVPVADFLGVAW